MARRRQVTVGSAAEGAGHGPNVMLCARAGHPCVALKTPAEALNNPQQRFCGFSATSVCDCANLSPLGDLWLGFPMRVWTRVVFRTAPACGKIIDFR